MMNQEALHALALQYLIFDAGLSRANLIRKIQLESNHAVCFSTGKRGCDEKNCLWFDECMSGQAGDDAPEPLAA